MFVDSKQGAIDTRKDHTYDPFHPGDFLAIYIEDAGMTVLALSQYMGCGVNQLRNILSKTTAVTAFMAWKLGWTFGTGPEFWMQTQQEYNIHKNRPGCEIPCLPKFEDDELPGLDKDEDVGFDKSMENIKKMKSMDDTQEIKMPDLPKEPAAPKEPTPKERIFRARPDTKDKATST